MQGRIRIAIACAGLLATSVAHAGAQTTFRETGSVTVGGYIVWVRGTSANAVELFVGRGFRDAFAHAHEMDAAKLQHWIDSVRAIAPLPADDSSAVDARARGSLIGTDVTMMRRLGGSYSGLRLLVSGEEPIAMAEPTAREFIAVLDSAAHAARDLSQPATTVVATTVVATIAQAPATAPAPTPPAPPPPAPTPPAPTPVATPDTATHPAVVPPSPAHVVVTPAPPPPAPPPAISTSSPATAVAVAVAAASPPAPATPLIGVAPVSAEASPAVPLGPSTAEAPPELVLLAPSEPVILLASRVDIMPLPLPPPAIPPAAPPPAPDTLPDAPADKLIHTPLGPFTIPGALLADRDKEAQYCYTQLGLKYNPDLKGEITVKVSVSSDGAVQDAVVTKRSWQGISAGEVESCVRALAHDWTFPSSDPSITDGAKLLTFSFAP